MWVSFLVCFLLIIHFYFLSRFHLSRCIITTSGFTLACVLALAITGCRAGLRTTFSGNRLPDIVPGQPGVDYPVASRVPATQFRCEKQAYPGFFADPEAGCQVKCGRANHSQAKPCGSGGNIDRCPAAAAAFFVVRARPNVVEEPDLLSRVERVS